MLLFGEHHATRCSNRRSGFFSITLRKTDLDHVLNRVGSVVVMSVGATFVSGKKAMPPFDLPTQTDVLVSENLTVLILHERWSPILVSASPPAVILSGQVALPQAGIGQRTKPLAR